MKCPWCQTPQAEAALQCSNCGLNVAAARKYFGQPPALQPGVNDLTGSLAEGDLIRLEERIVQLQKTLPQVGFSVVFGTRTVDAPVSTWAWWLFNESGVCADSTRGSQSRNLLLAVDAPKREASLQIGYGLEALVVPDRLQNEMGPALAKLVHGELAESALLAIQGAERELIRACENLEPAFGASMETMFEQDMGCRVPWAEGAY